MAAFFLLMSTYLVPAEGDREEFFSELVQIDVKGRADGQGSLQWYKVNLQMYLKLLVNKADVDFDSQHLTIGVLQWIPVSIILWIATAITMGTGSYCATSKSLHFAHIWVSSMKIR
jgi:hypothetical protein